MTSLGQSEVPRRVLMTADTVGGVWTYALELSRGLKRFDIEIALFSMGGMPSAEQRQAAASLSNLTLVATDDRVEWMNDCETDLVRSGHKLLELEEQFKPDVVHINGYWHARLPHSAPVLVAAHSCVASWWQACRGGKLPHEWDTYRRWARDAVASADLLVAPTETFLHQFGFHHGLPARTCVIWNGRDSADFSQGPKQAFVLAAGRVWDEAKNVRAVCKAAKGLDIPVAVAGEASAPSGNCMTMHDVQFLGRLSPRELARWMAKAAIFAAPARYEPFGLTILEAALSRCALVLGDIPSLRELWDGAAVFVDPEDDRHLHHALKSLARDSSSVATLAMQAMDRAQRYSVQRMAARYCQAYSQLVSSALGAAA